jgi:heat shock protein HslJ
MNATLVCLLFGVMTAAGCTENLTAPLDVVGGTWQLVSIKQGDADPIVVDNPSRYTLRLNEDGRAAVKSDCNSCGGSYTFDNATVAFAPLGSEADWRRRYAEVQAITHAAS